MINDYNNFVILDYAGISPYFLKVTFTPECWYAQISGYEFTGGNRLYTFGA